MKDNITIALVGHGTGGHFYPLIAVAESLRSKSKDDLNLVYFGPSKYNEESLLANDITYSYIPAGKLRNYFSFKNFFDIGKTILGIIMSFAKLIYYYPDVVFSKGGHAAMPILVAARILRIPIMIHDSDIVPGRVTAITEKWSRRVALAWPDAAGKITNPHKAVVGIPIRKALFDNNNHIGGREFLNIPPEAVVILVIGGSQGAEIINTAILASLQTLLKQFYIIHQVGENNFEQMDLASKTLLNEEELDRYKIFGNLDALGLARAYGAADVVVTRAGATTLFEIAAIAQVPALVIPITKSVNDHQRKNAYAFQEAGVGVVIEESNFKPEILSSDITKVINDSENYQAMKQAAKQFSPVDTADKIANELIQISHEH